MPLQILFTQQDVWLEGGKSSCQGVASCYHLLSYSHTTHFSIPCHECRQSLTAPRDRSASSSRQGLRPRHVAAARHTHTTAGYAQDHIITHVFGAVAHRCEHCSCHAALHACGAEKRRSCRGRVAVTPPQSCWSAQLLRGCRQQTVRQRLTHKKHRGYYKVARVRRCRQPLPPQHAVARATDGYRGRRRQRSQPDEKQSAGSSTGQTDSAGGKGGNGEAVARVWRRQPPEDPPQRARRTRRGPPVRPRPRTSRRRRRRPLLAAAAAHAAARCRGGPGR
jgi:hypothetical protein